MADIWVRYNAWENYNPALGLDAFNDPHESVWYPVANEIPHLRLVTNDVLSYLPEPVELGGIIITKIPPGCVVQPHVDAGWHATYYRDKYALQLKGNMDQAFNFQECSISALPGQVYWFDNSQLHWVTNESDEDRITMIICTRRKI